MRICSLLPGATEVIAALGLADHLVGISHECDFPPEVATVPVMVRPHIDQRMASPDIDRAVTHAVAKHQPLYALDAQLLREAEPDLIITQDLCHVCAVTPSEVQRAIASLPGPPRVLTLKTGGLEAMLTDIERIGEATDHVSEARALTSRLRGRLDTIRRQVASEQPVPSVACVEWLDPLYAAGHWVPEMLWWAGGQDVLGTAGAPSARLTWDQLVAASPNILIVMPCGFSVERTLQEIDRLTTHPDWNRLPAVRENRVFAVDSGAYFSRPGPRLVDGTEMLAALCHPSRFGHAIPAGAHRIVTEPSSARTDAEG
jgi:iron complex transport system substrate-binding protein